MRFCNIFLKLLFTFLFALFFSSCKKDEVKSEPDPPIADEYDPNISDSYSSIADISFSSLWGSYNLHDPSIIKEGNQYYIFSTDVMFGPLVRSGIMYRKSSDLVHWNFLGWVFDGVPSAAKQYVSNASGGLIPGGVWAPFIIKEGNVFRLYYSVSVTGVKASCICLATSASLDGPWIDQGIVLATGKQDQMNSIDPSIITDRINGRQWMAYGSWFAGIFMAEIDPLTGKLKNTGDYGHLIAFRNKYMDAMEGCEIVFSQGRLGANKYFMNLHVHRLVWTPSGWPVISPERYAGVPETGIISEDLIGKWEHIDLIKTTSKNQLTEIEIKSGGTIGGVPLSSWSFQDGTLTLSFNNNSTVYKAKVLREWDWENKKRTIVYTGLTSNGYSGWGKKI